MLNTANTEFSFTEVWFTDQNSKSLEIKDNVSMRLITGQITNNWVEPKYRKYVKGYGFLSNARKFGDKYGKKLMDNATKTGIDAAKTASKRIVQKTAEVTGNLIGNKIANKISSVSKTKSKEKEDARQEIYRLLEKRQQTIDYLRLF